MNATAARKPAGAPPPLAFHGDRETFHEIVLLTYGELNEVRTASDASFMERTLLERYRASEGHVAMLWHGALERLRNVVARRIAGEPPLPAPYWDAAMRMNMPAAAEASGYGRTQYAGSAWHGRA